MLMTLTFKIGEYCKIVSWLITKRLGTWKTLDADKLKAEKIKVNIPAKMEYRYIKQVFGYSKVRYRGLLKKYPLVVLADHVQQPTDR